MNAAAITGNTDRKYAFSVQSRWEIRPDYLTDGVNKASAGYQPRWLDPGCLSHNRAASFRMASWKPRTTNPIRFAGPRVPCPTPNWWPDKSTSFSSCANSQRNSPWRGSNTGIPKPVRPSSNGCLLNGWPYSVKANGAAMGEQNLPDLSKLHDALNVVCEYLDKNGFSYAVAGAEPRKQCVPRRSLGTREASGLASAGR